MEHTLQSHQEPNDLADRGRERVHVRRSVWINSWDVFYLELGKGYPRVEAGVIVSLGTVSGIVGTIASERPPHRAVQVGHGATTQYDFTAVSLFWIVASVISALIIGLI